MAIHVFLTTAILPLLLMIPTGHEWERQRPSAREERIARAERTELVRSALRSAAAHGYYVFDELMTEGTGMIDFLAVGPVGACVVVVRDEDGIVTADVDGTLYLDGRRFDDDPQRQAEDLVDDVTTRLSGTGAHTYHIICFTRAEIYYRGRDQDVLQGICPIWDLALPFASAAAEHSPADVAETADRVRMIYGRPALVTPEETDTP